MAVVDLAHVLRRLRCMVELRGIAQISDRALLERFFEHRDETAFTALVERHGPMVLAVCRRVLGNSHDAEDAFQAAFFVLAKKGRSIRRRQVINGWLYRVAYRLALRLRADIARQRVEERRAQLFRPRVLSANGAGDADLSRVLDQELIRLPEKHRLPLLLCDLGGKTHAEAAHELGWPVGSMSRRLARGRELLRRRLVKRGVLLGESVASTLTILPAPAVFATVAESTVKGALAFAFEKTLTTELVTPRVLSLVERGIRSMAAAKLLLGAVVGVSVALMAGGAGLIALRASRVRSADSEAATVPEFRTQQEPGPKNGPVFAAAQDRKERPVDQVRDTIDRGVKFLREQGKKSGNWEVDTISTAWPGGETSLALLALLSCGVDPNDPLIGQGLHYLRTIDPQHTYVVGLQTMAFAAAGQAQDRARIQRNVDWLIQNRIWRDYQFIGWSYGKSRSFGGTDNSNTHYALLALHEAQIAGVKIDREVWKAIQDYYIRTQRDGGWGYAPVPAPGSTPTMTTAGLWGLVIAGTELNGGRETLLPKGPVSNCGVYSENKAVANALDWIGSHFRIEDRHATYYHLDGIELAGRLTGRRFLGEHDWYREGCDYLVTAQNTEGYWHAQVGHDAHRIVSTSFALLFLSRGRTPILVHKLVHGPGEDWNNDHNDAHNLVEYARRELFKRQPLDWQIFDAKRSFVKNDHDALMTIVRELKQSPIAYFNGHKAPAFTRAEEAALKNFVAQGGFILAESCCGKPDFDRGFRELMKRLFPDTPLQPLHGTHPIWHAHFRVKAGDPFELEGIEQGGKTVVVYSPQDLSCLWDANQSNTGRGQAAFRLGANIVAYATGMEMPKPRLAPGR
jgi:RNA polymerase sigma factor (sigma-70 family)